MADERLRDWRVVRRHSARRGVWCANQRQAGAERASGLIMLLTTLASFIAMGFFSLMPVWALGVLCLVLFGWLSAISSLLQYT